MQLWVIVRIAQPTRLQLRGTPWTNVFVSDPRNTLLFHLHSSSSLLCPREGRASVDALVAFSAVPVD